MSPKPLSCPLCGQPALPDVRPFCSTACRDRDLLQWLGEGYRVPDSTEDDAGEKSSNYRLDSEAD
ncbi:MAG: DNA gyrase inhibitor YacG [Sphingomonadaceae bacterium]|nr:DNA gyrase inhibitor YacG [Sphingomonadaceae bacterium]MBH2000313.1 DNA gyrase inhibitor YacG [Sphingomonadaceae bacterium]